MQIIRREFIAISFTKMTLANFLYLLQARRYGEKISVLRNKLQIHLSQFLSYFHKTTFYLQFRV